MAFHLPDYGDLTTEQKKIVNLPSDKNFVIKGSPGTGKSVIAIYRAEQMRNKRVLFLVYNRPLMNYLKSAFKSRNCVNCDVMTLNSWNDRYFGYDHIIIDEAQDFSVEDLEKVIKVGRNITCFVDPNQAIEDDKSDVLDVINTICSEAPYTLNWNFRNTPSIIPVMKLFWGGKGIFAQPNPQKKEKNEMLPVLIKNENLSAIVKFISYWAKNNKETSIGVIVNRKDQEKILEALEEDLDGFVEIEMYKSVSEYKTIDFDKAGIKVLAYGTMKGLEFDSVFLPNFDRVGRSMEKDPDVERNRAYVATSRPREALFIFCSDLWSSYKYADTMSVIRDNQHLFNRLGF